MNIDCGHDGDDSFLRTCTVYPSQPDLAVGYNFGLCLKQYSLADLLKYWSLWHLFKMELRPHWVVTEDNEINLRISSQCTILGQTTKIVVS